jgi:leucyl aminopeptidase
LILTVGAGGKLGDLGQKLDQRLGGAIKRAIVASSFTGAKNKTLSIYAPAKTRLTRIVLVGLGDAAEISDLVCQKVGAAAYNAVAGGKEALATLWFDAPKGMKLDSAAAAANFTFGLKLRSYRFDKYRTKMKSEQKTSLKTLAAAGADAKAAYATLDKIADGVFWARDVVTEPANVIYPEVLAEEAKKLEKLGLKVDVLDEIAMTELGMGALLGVAQGSKYPPRLVTLFWEGDPEAKDKRPVAFIGKGVTFDSGGISLKPGAGMWDMKFDMAGAAAVIGAMKVLASRKAKANVVGVVGLVENMPDANAMRPGDVVKSMSGQTIEVLNTDAEGRLVLADAIWYAQETFKPRCVIDLATLTGALKYALGSEYAGLFVNDEALKTQLLKAGEGVDEPLWQLPLNDAYDKMLDSVIADVKNIADGAGGAAGSATGAHFIGRFVKKGMAWAHLDIAWMVWATKDLSLAPKGATGFGVRLLDRLVADNFEAK